MKNRILGIAVIAVAILLVMKLMRPSIQGQWIAEHVIDNQSDTLTIDASVIQLHINDDRYTFSSTLNHKEAGTIKRKGNHLIVQNDGTQPYKMGISEITRSQLTLSMNVNNTPRIMIMRRSD